MLISPHCTEMMKRHSTRFALAMAEDFSFLISLPRSVSCCFHLLFALCL